VTINSHVIKLKHIAWTLGILISISTGIWRASAWAQDVKNDIKQGIEKDKQQDTLMAKFEQRQDGMYEMMRIMFVIDSLERAGDTKLMEKVYAITNNKDTVPKKTLMVNEYSTDNLVKDSL